MRCHARTFGDSPPLLQFSNGCSMLSSCIQNAIKLTGQSGVSGGENLTQKSAESTHANIVNDTVPDTLHVIGFCYGLIENVIPSDIRNMVAADTAKLHYEVCYGNTV